MLWVLIRSASARRFLWVPTTYLLWGKITKMSILFGWKKKKKKKCLIRGYGLVLIIPKRELWHLLTLPLKRSSPWENRVFRKHVPKSVYICMRPDQGLLCLLHISLDIHVLEKILMTSRNPDQTVWLCTDWLSVHVSYWLIDHVFSLHGTSNCNKKLRCNSHSNR